MKKLFFVAIALIGLALFHTPLYAKPVCKTESFPPLPDVAITSTTKEATPAPHCKVAGVIGPEIHFELILPEKWNGKFVMGGGGGFVESVINTSLMLGSLQAGYASVDTDTGHQAILWMAAGRITTWSAWSTLAIRRYIAPRSRQKR